MLNVNLSFLPLLFFLVLSLWHTPTLALKRSYIVYMGEHLEGLQLTTTLLRSRADSHIEFLGSLFGWKKAKEAIFYSFTRYINGFAAELDENEVAAIQQNPLVVSIFPNEERKLHTTHSWEFLSLERNGIVPSDSLWRKAKFGEDIIIANFDSGVWPESPSFNDEGFGPIPSKWKGKCENDRGKPFPCNRKLIGAKYFYEGYVKGRGYTDLTVDSPRDYDGHGTHTLSTAGGSFVPEASVLGMFNGTAKGGSPKARVATYKVCWPTCWDADIIKAFDHAIADGVDVISISLGGLFSNNYYDNGIAVGAFSAIKHGITVVASAGNDGPDEGSVKNVAPWLITVAASTTDRLIFSYIHLQNGVRLKGKSLWTPLPEERFYPLISGADARAANGSAWEALRALDPEKVKGKILVCLVGEIPRTVKGKHAALTGAVGMILCNDKINGNDIMVDTHLLPTIHLTYTDGLAIFAYINSTKNPMGLMTSSKVEFGIKPTPLVAHFSSRGPNPLTPEILKPDITAPGVDIMAAFMDGTSPSGIHSDPRRTKYMFMSGTSMSCPHVAGIVGLLKVLHPEWSPAAIRSALMTTASTIDNTNRPMLDQSLVEATPFSYGAGHIRPDLAADPGLVYDLNPSDYDNFLCAHGFNRTIMERLTKRHKCGNEPSLLDFNYPSITVPKLSCSVTVKRILKNVGSPGIYVARISEPCGVSVSVQPKSLKFGKIDEERKFHLTLVRNKAVSTQNKYLFGELVWSDGRHNVRSPIVVGAL
ncbi:Cucumisin [Handroanthus impetiginosus]|uniref:Cucumisin n=1 Tax=Handroanthus impetiginosus TaxID=429701 RepID=A0A2G9FZ73_9LAMI|nr:Cucumisin [Handroanthus impetiginosus]